jgi:LmbE family N-acetylglucosaminyl deacetylase
MNVLVIAPHPDDESIGCGGTICLHTGRGDRVAVTFMTSGELGLKDLPREEAWRVREREAAAAAEVLGVSVLEFLRCPDWYMGEAIEEAAGRLAPVVEREAPDVVYVPHAAEWHPDHRACLPALRAALGGRRPTLLAYEVWTPLAEWDHVENVDPVMARKLRAVRAYRSQVGQLRYDRAVRGLNLFRGPTAGGCRYAEVFRLCPGEEPS